MKFFILVLLSSIQLNSVRIRTPMHAGFVDAIVPLSYKIKINKTNGKIVSFLKDFFSKGTHYLGGGGSKFFAPGYCFYGVYQIEYSDIFTIAEGKNITGVVKIETDLTNSFLNSTLSFGAKINLKEKFDILVSTVLSPLGITKHGVGFKISLIYNASKVKVQSSYFYSADKVVGRNVEINAMEKLKKEIEGTAARGVTERISEMSGGILPNCSTKKTSDTPYGTPSINSYHEKVEYPVIFGAMGKAYSEQIQRKIKHSFSADLMEAKLKKELVGNDNQISMLCEEVHSMIEKTNERNMIIITGATGTGKSYSASLLKTLFYDANYFVHYAMASEVINESAGFFGGCLFNLGTNEQDFKMFNKLRSSFSENGLFKYISKVIEKNGVMPGNKILFHFEEIDKTLFLTLFRKELTGLMDANNSVELNGKLYNTSDFIFIFTGAYDDNYSDSTGRVYMPNIYSDKKKFIENLSCYELNKAHMENDGQFHQAMARMASVSYESINSISVVEWFKKKGYSVSQDDAQKLLDSIKQEDIKINWRGFGQYGRQYIKENYPKKSSN